MNWNSFDDPNWNDLIVPFIVTDNVNMVWNILCIV